MRNHLVIFQPSGQRGWVEDGKNLLDTSRELGVDIEAICGGQKTCGKCKIQIREGRFERLGIHSRRNHLSKLSEKEELCLTEQERSDNYRLACSTRIHGDILVYVPEESRAGRHTVRKDVTLREINLKPSIRTYKVVLEEPALSDSKGDVEWLIAGLESQYGLKGLKANGPVFDQLHSILSKSEGLVSAAVWMDKEILRVVSGPSMACYGLAVDLGTTTVAGYLCDLKTGRVIATDSLMNPQVTYGEDIMSRISYIMAHDKGLEELHKKVIGVVNQIVTTVSRKAEITPDDILELCIVGNTVMHHICLNISPIGVGRSPFVPEIQDAVDIKSRELGINVNASANVHMLPVVAGFIGADSVALLLAEAPYKKDAIQLIIDIGTNGEILLGNQERMLSTSCATGPALEGAHISFGMRASPGAISSVRIDENTLDPSYKIITGEENDLVRGICGTGVIDAVAELFRTGIIERNGRFTETFDCRHLIRNEKTTRYIIAPKEETAIGRDISITIDDVRAVQLAKGAIYTASKLLMKQLGITEVDRVALAGAFGSYINRKSAMLMGMFPDCSIDNVVSVGNAAGDGARMALLDIDKRNEAQMYARRIEYVELTLEEDFEYEFAKAMYFPHMSDNFPSLKGLFA